MLSHIFPVSVPQYLNNTFRQCNGERTSNKLPCALVWRHLSINGSKISIQTVFVPVNQFVTKIQQLQEKHHNFQELFT